MEANSCSASAAVRASNWTQTTTCSRRVPNSAIARLRPSAPPCQLRKLMPRSTACMMSGGSSRPGPRVARPSRHTEPSEPKSAVRKLCISEGDDSRALSPAQPRRRGRVARHAPVAARRQGDAADLRAVGQARALELVREETLREDFQPAANFVGAVCGLERRVAGQEQDLLRRRAVAQEVEQEEVV